MQAETAVGPGTEREYVSLGRRLLAISIDNSVWFFFYVFFLGGVVSAVADESTEAAGVIVFVYLSLWFNYFSFAEWRWGQTIGKNATGIMVTTVDGEGLTFGQASMRNLLRLIDWLVIGWVMIASTDRKQRLGDRVAKTVVVRRPRHTGATMRKAPELTAAVIAGGSSAPAAVDPPQQGSDPLYKEGDESPGAKPGIRGRLPEINWPVRKAVWGLIAGFVLAIFSTILVVPFDPDLDSDGALLAAQALFGLSLLVVPIGIAGWKFKDLRGALGRLGLRRFKPSAFGWALLMLFAYYVFAGLFSSLVLEPKQDDVGGELGVGDENLLIAVAAVVEIAVLAPISEEIFFRGFFFSGLRSKFSLWPAAIISGLVFGSVHVTTGATAAIPLAVLGVGLAWLYDRTGSLWPCIGVHVFNNALALALLSSTGGARFGRRFERHVKNARGARGGVPISYNAALVNPPGRKLFALLAFAALLVAIPVSNVGAADAPADDPADASVATAAESVATTAAKAPSAGAAATGITVDVKGNPRRVSLLKKVTIAGALTGAVATDNVQLTAKASGQDIFSKKISPKADGSFEVPLTVSACCRYVITAENAKNKDTAAFSVDVPKHLSKGRIGRLFNRSLQAQGFHTGTKSGSITLGTRLAIKAFRKTNHMARNESYKPGIFRELLEGKGAFKPRYNDGRHVEVDISRQVMSLIQGDKPIHTFHVSTGSSATPTIRGRFRFYMRQPGYNAKRMYFSVYFRGGYATHGYNPVPNYNASHGCVRNPIPFSRFIYNWVSIGMPIYVYG
jgi:membrane protease YdiL (CAAX protease family)/lipoprotein-anchoring transpeptidase ErfK/SrfK